MMIITLKHREKAENLKDSIDIDLSIKDTLKVIYCLVEDDKKNHVKELYNNLFEVKSNDSIYKKIFRMFARQLYSE